MKKNTLILTSIILGFQLVNTANAADGTIQFTGNILDTACTVTAGEANATATFTITYN